MKTTLSYFHQNLYIINRLHVHTVPSRSQVTFTRIHTFLLLHVCLYITLSQCCNFRSMLQSLAHGNVLHEHYQKIFTNVNKYTLGFNRYKWTKNPGKNMEEETWHVSRDEFLAPHCMNVPVWRPVKLKMESNRYQSRIIGHHLAKVEEIPTSGYRDMSLGRLTNWRTDRNTRHFNIIIFYILGFTLYGVIIVNQLYCGCCDILSMFMDEKCQQLVKYRMCKVPKTDSCMI